MSKYIFGCRGSLDTEPSVANASDIGLYTNTRYALCLSGFKLQILGIDDPENITVHTPYTFSSKVYSVIANGNFAYLLANNSLYTANISNVDGVTLIDTKRTSDGDVSLANASGTGGLIALSGNYLFTSSRTTISEVGVWDISASTGIPVFIRKVVGSGTPSWIMYENNMLCVHGDYLHVINSEWNPGRRRYQAYDITSLPDAFTHVEGIILI